MANPVYKDGTTDAVQTVEQLMLEIRSAFLAQGWTIGTGHEINQGSGIRAIIFQKDQSATEEDTVYIAIQSYPNDINKSVLEIYLGYPPIIESNNLDISNGTVPATLQSSQSSNYFAPYAEFVVEKDVGVGNVYDYWLHLSDKRVVFYTKDLDANYFGCYAGNIERYYILPDTFASFAIAAFASSLFRGQGKAGSSTGDGYVLFTDLSQANSKRQLKLLRANNEPNIFDKPSRVWDRSDPNVWDGEYYAFPLLVMTESNSIYGHFHDIYVVQIPKTEVFLNTGEASTRIVLPAKEPPNNDSAFKNIAVPRG